MLNAIAKSCCVVFFAFAALWAEDGGSASGIIQGVTRNTTGDLIGAVQVTAESVMDKAERSTVSGPDGTFSIADLQPGLYRLTAEAAGLATVTASTVEVAAEKTVPVDLTIAVIPMNPSVKARRTLFGRFVQAYADDWRGVGDDGPAPAFRGFPAPVDMPPYPFSVWPYGGSPVIGQPDTNLPPLMQALYAGPNGKAWEESKIKIYGWVNAGFNVSSSDRGRFANAPAAYAQVPNSIQLDQWTLYIERVPDTVQTDHFDWGFRFTNLYGMDYRFTTSKGILSNQLLGQNSTYGYDPVMAYVDLYFPKVADGLNVRIGRYISLPDIEAQLAPNNYTYTHSLTYTYDCYTQDGINGTLKLTNHWMVQIGLSAGCDAAPWTKDAKLTGNACVGYTFREGGENIYACANSINDGKYAYNNLAAYYLTWYHKINGNWHTDTEAWYQDERGVPSIFGSLPIENGANGAWCQATEQKCFAPEWAMVNYVERQIGKKNYLSVRNEFFDDIKGQRTGYKTRYSEHMVGWGHWIGTSILMRPEVSYLRAYDYPAFDSGTKKNQVLIAGDLIWFY